MKIRKLVIEAAVPSIGGQVLVSAFQIAFGALCFALALAFGLGGRDVAARILDGWLKK